MVITSFAISYSDEWMFWMVLISRMKGFASQKYPIIFHHCDVSTKLDVAMDTHADARA